MLTCILSIRNTDSHRYTFHTQYQGAPPRTIPVFQIHIQKFFYYYTNSFCFVKPDYSAVLNNAVERYLSPESGRSATIVFPLFQVSWQECLLPLMRHLMKYLQVFLRFLQMFFLLQMHHHFNCNNFIIYLCIQYLWNKSGTYSLNLVCSRCSL